ncbi:MAG: hypothetical protein M0C28_17315 [Candidatus Moduliflexus flocculans]|nr:hypothetical protein [Candidatus Moduliflexus flocculans]
MFVSVGRWQHHLRHSQGLQGSARPGLAASACRACIGVQAEGSAAIANAFHAGNGDDHPRVAPTPWPTASRSTCRATACGPCAPPARPAGLTSPSRTSEILAGDCRAGPGGHLCRTGRRHRLCRAASRPLAAGLGRCRMTRCWCSNTGSGLKDVRAAMQAVPQRRSSSRRLEAL